MARSASPDRGPPANRLLAALPRPEYERLAPCLEPVPLEFRAVLHEADRPVDFLYFPCAGAVSLVRAPDPTGRGIAVGMVGRQGALGLAVLEGAHVSLTRWVVQLPGTALRMRAADFRALVQYDSRLRGLMVRYMHAFIGQVFQTAACNALHPVGQRLAGLLVQMHDHAGADAFPLTHEFLGQMLGVRRASVTGEAGKLQGVGVVRYGKGSLTVVDRQGLEAAACGCHRVIQEGMDRVFA
jgi:CRP-like cAMP-binding protein